MKPTHGTEAVVKALGLENSKEVTTPGEKVNQDEAFRALELPHTTSTQG